MKTLFLVFTALISLNAFAAKTVIQSEAYTVTSEEGTSVMLFGNAAETMYNSARAADVENTTDVVDGKVIDGFLCVEIAKQPGLQDERSSKWSYFKAFVSIGGIDKGHLVMAIHEQAYMCTTYDLL